jgi:hypothetical protein
VLTGGHELVSVRVPEQQESAHRRMALDQSRARLAQRDSTERRVEHDDAHARRVPFQECLGLVERGRRRDDSEAVREQRGHRLGEQWLDCHHHDRRQH